MKSLIYFLIGVTATVLVFELELYEKIKVDVENTIYPLIECHVQSVTLLDEKFIF